MWVRVVSALCSGVAIGVFLCMMTIVPKWKAVALQWEDMADHWQNTAMNCKTAVKNWKSVSNVWMEQASIWKGTYEAYKQADKRKCETKQVYEKAMKICGEVNRELQKR